MLSDLRNLRAIKFVDNAGDLKSIGLDPPQTKVDSRCRVRASMRCCSIGKPENADAVTPMMRQGEADGVPGADAEVEKLG